MFLKNEKITLEIKKEKFRKFVLKKANILRKVYSNQKVRKLKLSVSLVLVLIQMQKCVEKCLDEGILGTVHFGMGLSTEGGKNQYQTPFHLDHINLKPNVFVDSKKINQ